MSSLLNSDQIIKRVFDESSNRIAVDAQVTATMVGAQEVVISASDDSIKIGDGTDFLAVNADGSINVNVSSATVSGTVAVSNFPATQPVSGSISVSNFPTTQNVLMLNTFVPNSFDYVGGSFPNTTTDIYTYKTGGSSGTTVATITVLFTDTTRTKISSITKA